MAKVKSQKMEKKYELKKLAELKAKALLGGNDTLFEACERQAKELCWFRSPEAEFDTYFQDQYDEYYAHYESCVKILEAGKKLPAEKIDEVLTVVSSGGCIVGCMSWETPYIKLKNENGDIFLWVSSKIEELGFYAIKIGTQLKISAFVRKDSNHLFRVKAELVDNQ